jgi:hypothetical protein
MELRGHRTAIATCFAFQREISFSVLRDFFDSIGQNAKYSSRVDVFRFASKLRRRSMRSALRICANWRPEQAQQILRTPNGVFHRTWCWPRNALPLPYVFSRYASPTIMIVHLPSFTGAVAKCDILIAARDCQGSWPRHPARDARTRG